MFVSMFLNYNDVPHHMTIVMGDMEWLTCMTCNRFRCFREHDTLPSLLAPKANSQIGIEVKNSYSIQLCIHITIIIKQKATLCLILEH